jgi:hypothetical protein
LGDQIGLAFFFRGVCTAVNATLTAVTAITVTRAALAALTCVLRWRGFRGQLGFLAL